MRVGVRQGVSTRSRIASLAGVRPALDLDVEGHAGGLVSGQCAAFVEMPKVVDHEQRRRELGHAVWRVIRRDGVERASIRTVAAEAGWSPGALRHYFATQSELLAFAMRLVVGRIEARLAALHALTDGASPCRPLCGPT